MANSSFIFRFIGFKMKNLLRLPYLGILMYKYQLPSVLYLSKLQTAASASARGIQNNELLHNKLVFNHIYSHLLLISRILG